MSWYVCGQLRAFDSLLRTDSPTLADTLFLLTSQSILLSSVLLWESAVSVHDVATRFHGMRYRQNTYAVAPNEADPLHWINVGTLIGLLFSTSLIYSMNNIIVPLIMFAGVACCESRACYVQDPADCKGRSIR